MRFHYGYEAQRRVENNGTFIADLSCCGQVISNPDRCCHVCGEEVLVFLNGIRNQQSQKWRWLITMSSSEGSPIKIGTLCCAHCERGEREIVTRERQCKKCRAYSYVNVMTESGVWGGKMEVHRELSADPVRYNEMPQGVKVQQAKPGVLPNRRPLPIDTSDLDLFLTWLICPKCEESPDTISFSNPRVLDDDNRCETHFLEISAVLVRQESSIYVERQVYDYINDEPYRQEEADELRKQLICPACDDPITDLSLRCMGCGVIVDVELVRKPQQGADGSVVNTYTTVEIALRALGQTDRPEECIPMVGDWTNTPPVSDPVSAKESAADRYELYLKIKKLLRKHPFRAVSEQTGRSVGALQYLMNNPPSPPEDE